MRASPRVMAAAAALACALVFAGGPRVLAQNARPAASLVERPAQHRVGTWATALVMRPLAAPAQPGAAPPLHFNDQTPDHLHPNDAGYDALGNAVDVGLFRPAGSTPITR